MLFLLTLYLFFKKIIAKKDCFVDFGYRIWILRRNILIDIQLI